LSMASIAVNRYEFRTATAVSMVVAVFLLLLTADFAIREFRVDLPTLGGAGRFLPWLAYPGIVSIIEARSHSDLAPRAVGIALPAVGLAVDVIRHPIDPIEVGLALGVAFGVGVGIWVGTSMLRHPRAGSTAIAVVAAGVSGLVAVTVVWLPFLALPPTLF
jgi:hypothetical protein